MTIGFLHPTGRGATASRAQQTRNFETPQELERLYAGLTRLASLPEKEMHALLTHVLAEEQNA